MSSDVLLMSPIGSSIGQAAPPSTYRTPLPNSLNVVRAGRGLHESLWRQSEHYAVIILSVFRGVCP